MSIASDLSLPVPLRPARVRSPANQHALAHGLAGRFESACREVKRTCTGGAPFWKYFPLIDRHVVFAVTQTSATYIVTICCEAPTGCCKVSEAIVRLRRAMPETR